MEKIDFVITWVNCNREKWQNSRKKYLKNEDVIENIDDSIERFRDWDLLKYWFRSIESNAEWVNKIFLVLSDEDQIPKWLNTNCERLKIVFHNEFIPDKYLPTFNSCVIEEYLYKIEGLSERFVYFNDDVFLNKKVKPSDFFVHGIPKDDFILTPINPSYDISANIEFNCMKIINKHFNFKNTPKSMLFNLKYGKYLYKNLTLSVYPTNVGIRFSHLCTSFNKKTFSEVWLNETKYLENVGNSKFRSNNDVSQWLFQFWQIASGNFKIRNVNDGKFYDLGKSFKKAVKDIRKSQHKIICINDSNDILDFEKKKKFISEVFMNKYGSKSQFER